MEITVLFKATNAHYSTTIERSEKVLDIGKLIALPVHIGEKETLILFKVVDQDEQRALMVIDVSPYTFASFLPDPSVIRNVESGKVNHKIVSGGAPALPKSQAQLARREEQSQKVHAIREDREKSGLFDAYASMPRWRIDCEEDCFVSPLEAEVHTFDDAFRGWDKQYL